MGNMYKGLDWAYFCHISVTICDTLPEGIEDKVKLTGSLSPPSGKYKREDCVGVKKRASRRKKI